MQSKVMTRGLKHTNVYKSLELVGIESVKFLRLLLSDNHKIATGDLFESIDYEVVETTNGLMLEILANQTYKFVDVGRKKSLSSNPKEIRKNMPPIKPIYDWIRVRNLKPRGKTKTELQLAYAIAYGIAKNGIKPLYLTDKLVKEIIQNRSQLIRQGWKKDIEEIIKEYLVFKGS